MSVEKVHIFFEHDSIFDSAVLALMEPHIVSVQKALLVAVFVACLALFALSSFGPRDSDGKLPGYFLVGVALLALTVFGIVTLVPGRVSNSQGTNFRVAKGTNKHNFNYHVLNKVIKT